MEEMTRQFESGGWTLLTQNKSIHLSADPSYLRVIVQTFSMLKCSPVPLESAGDEQVRVFDIETTQSAAPDGVVTEYNSRQSCIRILRCHDNRVKRIVVEESPDLFLSVGEDGTVRQHDMRTPHNCRDGTCPAPLTKVNHELSTLSLSPITPHQFVVAGEAPYGYLYDRRHVGRVLKREWGEVPRAGEEVTTCVRRFGRPQERRGEQNSRREHVTGARISPSNGHEVLLSYSGDRVYLYSTRDQPCSDDDLASPTTSIMPANATQPQKMPLVVPQPSSSTGSAEESQNQDIDLEDEDLAAFIEFDDPPTRDYQTDIPVIMPRCQYAGARNVATIKDVNFLGPRDEWVVSGSDDGNFFIWSKATGSLQGIYEGDSSVVNVIEGHPHFPLVAVSGIDTTVKLFAPTGLPSVFSRVDNADRIIESNERLSRARFVRYNFSSVLQAAMGGEEVSLPECTSQ